MDRTPPGVFGDSIFGLYWGWFLGWIGIILASFGVVLDFQDTWSWDIVRPTMCSWLHILGDFGKTFQLKEHRAEPLTSENCFLGRF